MTVDQLACFLAVAECYSFTEAAKKLYISHSAVSKAISSLEASLGVQLLVRDNRSVSLTPAGDMLLEKGGHLHRLWRDLEDRVSNIGSNLHGALTIFAPAMEAQNMFGIFQRMKERYPSVNLQIHPNENSLSIYDSICNGHADLGFAYSFAVPDEPSLVQKMTIFTDHFCVVTAPDHPFATLDSVTLSEALSQPIVFPPLGNRLQDAPLLRQVHRSFQPGDHQAQNLGECHLQVALGRGIAILPSTSATSQLPCCCIPLTDSIEAFTMQLLWRTDRVTPVTERFLELAREHAENINQFSE